MFSSYIKFRLLIKHEALLHIFHMIFNNIDLVGCVIKCIDDNPDEFVRKRSLERLQGVEDSWDTAW